MAEPTMIWLQHGLNSYRTRIITTLTIIVILLLVFLPVISTQVQAEVYQVTDLAYPLSVNPGDNVTFTINYSVPKRYMHTCRNGTEGKFVFWMSRDNGQPTRFESISGMKLLDNPGTYNLTSETKGRIAITYYLPRICGWSVTSTEVDVVCPSINITETTAFELLTWTDGTQTHVLHVEGDIDAYFFDKYLNPLGKRTEMSYKRDIEGIVVIVPSSQNSSVIFTISSIAQSEGDMTVLLVFVAIFVIIPAILIIFTRRRKKKEDSPKQ